MAKKRTSGGKRRRPADASEPRTAEPRTAEPRTPAPRTDAPRTPAPRTAEPRPPEEPAFWFGFEVSWAKLALGRVVLFGLLAIDALLQIRHAPRYGAGGFNVAQLPGLDGLGASHLAYEVAELVNAYLFVLAACGVATRLVLPIATAIYAWLYFGSQLDSYQHHYLVSLILLLACFIPWQRPADATPATRVRSWALRLVLVELGVMYLWAAISKMNSAWLDGRTLGDQIGGPLRGLIDATIGISKASLATIAVELALAAMVWNRRAWAIVAPLGILFHLGIVLSGLEIGLFAWLMIGLYVFVVPDRVWTWLAELAPSRGVRAVARVMASWFETGGGTGVVVAACGLGGVLVLVSRFDHARVVGALLTFAVIAAAAVGALRRRVNLAWLGCAHVLALGTWTVADRATTVAEDYYRFLGGSSRRFGDPADAEHAYRKLVEIVPDEESGHFHLAEALLARDASEEGLAELHEAERVAPGAARAFVTEARWLANHGHLDEAQTKARDAQRADPNDPEARDLLNSLGHGGVPNAGKRPQATTDDDSD